VRDTGPLCLLFIFIFIAIVFHFLLECSIIAVIWSHFLLIFIFAKTKHLISLFFGYINFVYMVKFYINMVLWVGFLSIFISF